MARLLRRKVRPAQHPLETYLREINDTPLLDAEAERRLAYRIEEGDTEARDHMVRANLRLVVNIARRYAGKGLAPARPDRGRQPRPAARRGRVRPVHEHALQHLRQLLDQAVHQAGAHQHGQDRPPAGLHGRAAQQVAAGDGRAARGAGPHADAGRDRRPPPFAEKEAGHHPKSHPHPQRGVADRPGRRRLVARRDADRRAHQGAGRRDGGRRRPAPRPGSAGQDGPARGRRAAAALRPGRRRPA